MITNDLAGSGVASGTSKAAFRELKRKARAVKARPRAKTGGRGCNTPPVKEMSIHCLSETNISEKEVPSAITTALTREDSWRSQGDIQVQILGRSLNPRILSIRLPSGDTGSAVINPVERKKFAPKKPVWVRKESQGKDWVVVGRYSQWGVRHS